MWEHSDIPELRNPKTTATSYIIRNDIVGKKPDLMQILKLMIKGRARPPLVAFKLDGTNWTLRS